MMHRGSRKRRAAAGLMAAAFTLLGGVLLWAAAAAGAQVRLPVRPPRAVLTETEAFVLGEAQALAGPVIRSVSPMPDGPFALIVRNVPDDMQQAVADAEAGRPFRSGEAQVLLWNRRTGRVTVMWRQRADDRTTISLEGAEWLPGSDTAVLQPFVTLREPGGAESGREETASSLLLVSTRATAARAVPVEPGTSFLVAPRHPFALLTRSVFAPGAPPPGGQPGPQPRASVRVLRPDGSVGPPITLPAAGGSTLWTGVSEDGTYAMQTQTSGDAPARRTRRYAAVRLSDGAITPLEKLPENQGAGLPDTTPGPLPVRLVTSRATLSDDRDRREVVQSVWLERVEGEPAATTAPTAATSVNSAPPAKSAVARTGQDRERRALVTADGAAVTLMPDGSAALYLTLDGTLMAAPITRHDARAYREAQREMHRLKTMQNAKQVALGILMYAQDYDETLPPSADVSRLIDPYVRNPEVFQNPATGAFSFRFAGPAGGKLGSVERPAETVLGYLDGPGGRAVIYVDGHVSWEDAPGGGN